MGLPLYIAPADSDIPSESPSKGTADNGVARSSIRRNTRRRQLTETREHRVRLLAALQDEEMRSPPLGVGRNSRPMALGIAGPSPLAFPSNTEASGHSPSATEYQESRDLVRDQNSPSGPLPPERDTPEHGESFVRAEGRNDHRVPITTPTPWMSLRELTDLLSVAPPEPLLSDIMMHRARNSRQRQGQRSPVRSVSHSHRRRGNRVRYVDGLGDRDRSLSPEGDEVWDTLQSTLTPDPQPPSVGSSFASTTPSAAASQNTNVSSNTSITSPDAELEQPCEPSNENADGYGEDAGQRTDSSGRPALPERRPHAEAAGDTLHGVREGGDDWMMDMQRIVRGLASRQDIPDEWWAEAGLSRSMPWEYS